ncbi:MAG: M48 family metallopeptidase [Candidatus Freyarchaeota archaeon]
MNPLFNIFELVVVIIRFSINVSLWSQLFQVGIPLQRLESYVGALVFTMPFISLFVCKLLREDAYRIKTKLWLFTLLLPIVFVPLKFLISQVYCFVFKSPVNPLLQSVYTTSFLAYCAIQLVIIFFSFIFTVRRVKSLSDDTCLLPAELPTSGKGRVEKYRQLEVIVSRLVSLMETGFPEIFVLEFESPVVFTVDEGKERPLIVVSRGLLEMLDDDELEACLGHELAHIANRDCFVRKAASFLRAVMFYNPFGYFIESEIYREREFLADRACASVTKKPEALASALIKIAEYPTNPEIFTSRRNVLCLWKKYGFLLRKHPPLEERLKRLVRLAENREFL